MNKILFVLASMLFSGLAFAQENGNYQQTLLGSSGGSLAGATNNQGITAYFLEERMAGSLVDSREAVQNSSVDVQNSGARPVSNLSVPAAAASSNFVASISSGSTVVSLCGGLGEANLATCRGYAANLRTGDGLTIFGAGATNSLITPGGTYSGTVNTSGTSVSWASGTQFTGPFEAGATITINAVDYKIASVNSQPATKLTLTTSAGSQTDVAYSYNQFQAFPTIAAAPTGSGYVVPLPIGGATTYQYKIIARDIGGGYTAGSSAVTFSNGPGTLGAQSLSAISESRANNIVTVTTSARSPEVFTAGQMIRISGTSSDGSFSGWVTIQSVPNKTTITYASPLDSRTGAITSATGGTIQWFNCNHLILPTPGPGIYEYYIYGRVAADGYKLLGVSMPATNSPARFGGEVSYMKWDDFGSRMTGSFGSGENAISLPGWVPFSAPASPSNDNLTTTITSGAGTTTIGIANSAGATVVNAELLFDDAPGIKAAFSQATANNNGGGMVHFSSPLTVAASGPKYYYINSYLDLSSYSVGVSQSAAIHLGDTMRLGNGIQWHGDLSPANALTSPQFYVGSFTTIYTGSANPGILTAYPQLYGLTLSSTGNSSNALFIDGSGGAIPSGTLTNMNFASSGTAGDYMGIPVIFMSAPTVAAAGLHLSNINMSGGPTQRPGSTATPLLVAKAVGELTFDCLMTNRRGLFFRAGDAGVQIFINQCYENQGSITPFVTLWNANRSGSPGGAITIKNPIMDTSAETVFSNLGGQTQIALSINNVISGGAAVTSGYPASTANFDNAGLSQNINSRSVIGAIIGIPDGLMQNVGLQAINMDSLLAANIPFYTGVAALPAGATCSATSGTQYIYYTAIYPNFGAGPMSLRSTTTCDHGLVTIPAAIPGAIGYRYWSGSASGPGFLANIRTTSCSNIQSTGLTAEWIMGACGPSAPSFAGGGPAGIVNDTVWATNLQLGPSPAPTGMTSITKIYMDNTLKWPNFKPNGNAAYALVGFKGGTNPSVQTKRVTGCATIASMNATCDTTVTWPNAFGDTSYTAVCSGDAVGSGMPIIQGIDITFAKTASTITVRTLAITAAVAQFTTIDCTAVHD